MTTLVNAVDLPTCAASPSPPLSLHVGLVSMRARVCAPQALGMPSALSAHLIHQVLCAIRGAQQTVQSIIISALTLHPTPQEDFIVVHLKEVCTFCRTHLNGGSGCFKVRPPPPPAQPTTSPSPPVHACVSNSRVHGPSEVPGTCPAYGRHMPSTSWGQADQPTSPHVQPLHVHPLAC
jgi:hypothetical protein